MNVKNMAVIGCGSMGLAQAHLLNKLGYEVFGYDIKPKTLPQYIENLRNPAFEDIDLTFICTNEWQVDNAIQYLKKHNIREPYVIKSTTSPGTTERMMIKHKVHICHNPEFLRTKHSFEDIENPDRIVIGQCCDKHGKLLSHLYEPMNKPIYLTDPTTSELVKLTSNAYLSMLITFWNEIHKISTKLRLNTAEIAELVTKDSRMSTYGTRFFGKEFNGKCLPKDLNHLIYTYQLKNLNPSLLKTIKKINTDLSRKSKPNEKTTTYHYRNSTRK